ncbi:uncharacterized protein LOC111116243 [Crassostrea virginica]
MKIPLVLVCFTGTVLVDALENIIFGQTFGIYGTNLTDGLRHDSCITVNQSTALEIIFNLGKEYSFESIAIYFKESNISYISIADDISSTWRPFYDKIPSEVVFLGQRESNSVKVNINSNELFTVCEVEAIGCEKGRYGENCTVCDFPANCEICDVTDGSCYRCQSNFTGTNCLQENDNLLLGKRDLFHQNFYTSNTHQYGLDNVLLTDGKVEKPLCQKLEGYPTSFSAIVSFRDLLNIKMINVFMLFENIPNDENITLDIYVYAYGSGYNSRGTFNLSSDELYKIPFEMNTYIIYTGIENTYPDIPLSGSVYMCEMEVKGCLSGYYGTTCTRCNHSGCAADFCHSLDGSCVCASNNFDVTTCPEGVLCKSGWFGKYCDQRCSNHCNVSYECYQGNGTCIGGCADGWTSDRCDQGKTRNHNANSWLYIELTFDRFYEGVHRNFQKS